MATLLLQAAGAALGGVFGQTTAILGQAAGALFGNVIDTALLSPRRTVSGGRLTTAAPFSADDGAAVLRIYGTMRVPGTLIWATRFEEMVTTERRGGKAIGGGTKVREYTYFANVAFALCEGPIAGVRRIWADGRELDRTEFDVRIHTGARDQAPDPLISAKQGAGNTPAYRGMAYVVIEHMALSRFGNRIPQLQFEVMRPVGALERTVKAVTIIPGATEFGYHPDPITWEKRPGETVFLNRNVLHAESDWMAAMDELQALCPALEHVALVVAWFGDDLRCGTCTIKPGAIAPTDAGLGTVWWVGGVGRAGARQISQHGQGPAYGGTPDDAALLRAIADLKARGLNVTLYPFVMMDVPQGNSLPSPYGGTGQPAYPWRGRMTCHPAAGQPATVERTAAARAQVAAFLGGATPAQFGVLGGKVTFSGAASDWGYRRMILHYARLCALAGGVDAFLIGSELPGLTRIRDQADAFPFVEGLMQLAQDVRTMLGGNVKITYGADWSEYSGYAPPGAPGDLYHHLDPLWMHPAINAVGIDWYVPLTDWRDGDALGGNPDGMGDAHDSAAFLAGIVGGEGYDWYYASAADRAARLRTPITDGTYGKPWVWRFKDVHSWWSKPHVNRVGGVEAAVPTVWVPQGKPIWFTEIGCAAIDKGANQPNVFPDAKSSENARPHFSDGSRDDVQQRLYIEAHMRAFDPAHPDFAEGLNPVSTVYGGRMLDMSRAYLWAYDARPYPAFPLARDVWADGDNWSVGHWLNGRLGNVSLTDLVTAVLADHGLAQPRALSLPGSVDGFAVMRPESVRQTLEPLFDLYGIAWRNHDGQPEAFAIDALPAAPVLIDEIVAQDKQADITRTRSTLAGLPNEVILGFADPLRAYQSATERAHQAGGGRTSQQVMQVSAALDPALARGLAARWLARARGEAGSVQFATTSTFCALQPGDTFRLADDASRWRIERMTHGETITIEARRVARIAATGWLPDLPALPPSVAGVGKADIVLLDLPATPSDPARALMHIAAFVQPWQVQAVSEVQAGTERTLGQIERPATMGTVSGVPAFAGSGRVLNQHFHVSLNSGALESVTMDRLLGGANLAAMAGSSSGWEVFQFVSAEEIAAGFWRLSGLLRGQRGTEDVALGGIADGARFVLLNAAVTPFELSTPPEAVGTIKTGLAHKPAYDLSWQSVGHGGFVRPVMPPSPVLLRRTMTADGTHRFTWVRRGREDADAWEPSDIPLGETTERYGYAVFNGAGVQVRQGGGPVAHWDYGATERTADLGAAGAGYVFKVWQEGRLAGRGLSGSLAVAPS